MRTSDTGRRTAKLSRYLSGVAVAAAAVFALTAPMTGLQAQGRGAMGVSVTVVSFASSATISATAFSAHRRSGVSYVDLMSRLSISSQTAYSLRVRSETEGPSMVDGNVMVKSADGHFQRIAAGASPVLASAAGPSEMRALDLVLRVDAARNAGLLVAGLLVAELITARLDQ